MKEEKTVLYKEDGAVALISLNRPKQMNASSHQLRIDLRNAMHTAENNNDIRIVVLTGEGRGFSAGADLTESYIDEHATISQHILKDHKQIVDSITQSNKVYISALNGATAGVSLAYAMSCDMILMAESAYLYSPFVMISLVPDGGASWFMLKAFGYQRAFEMIAEGRKISAAECLQAGVINGVYSDDQLREKAMERAQKLGQMAPLTLKFSKKILRAAQNSSREDVTIMEAEYQDLCSRSVDFSEGVSAFMQKRKPEFKGK